MKNTMLFFLLILPILSGCWIQEPDTEDPWQQQEKKDLSKGNISTDQMQCFEAFKDACIQKQWQKAYNLLSKRWQQRKTLEQFQANMESVGHKHFEGVRVASLTQIVTRGKVTWCIIGTNQENNSTMYLIVQDDDGSWKLDGVRNID